MKGCKHPFGWTQLVTRCLDFHVLIATWCSACRDYVPLGKATDTPATDIEVRAAELAQTRSSESLMEWAGWQCHADDFPPNTGSAQAGWLAREIAFHKDPTP